MSDILTPIPHGWINTKFKDLIYFQEGPGLTSDLFKETGFPFLNIRCIDNGKINKEACQFISKDIANTIYRHFQLEQNDLVVSTSGTLGKKAYVRNDDIPLLLNTSIIRFKPKDSSKFSVQYLNYLLEDYRFQNDLYNLSTGSAQINVGPTHLNKISITIPELIEEQNKIASILSKLDEAITQTEQLIGKYKKIKEGLMHDLLTRGIDEQGNIRSEETHKFKDSPLGRIPEEWECVTIGDIIEKLRSGVTPRGGSEIYQKEGIMFLRSQNIYPYGFELEDVAYISYEINNKMLGSELKELDVLLNITGASIGRSTYVPAGFPTANVNQHVCSIRIYNPSEEKSIFLSSFLNSVYGQNQIAQHNAGSNRQGLNYSQIKQIYIPDFKSDYELSNFKITINKIENTINQYKNNLTKLQLKKSGLMNDLLTGKIRVQI